MNEAEIPVYEEDLFSPNALRNPFEHYRTIRDLGPVVRLKDPDVYALGRYADIREALRSSDILTTTNGFGFNDLINAPKEYPNILGSSGAYHDKLRGVLAPLLAPGALRERRAMLKDMISERVCELKGQPEFDAVSAIGQHLPLSAVRKLVGLPEEGSARMLDWATAGFNSIGPMRESEAADPKLAADRECFVEAFQYFASVDPSRLAKGSWAASIFEAVEQGRLMLPEARSLLSGLVMPSLDTTINAKSNLLYNLAKHPDQWQQLRANPSLIPSAVLEGVRFSATARWFARVALEDYKKGEVFVPKGGRLMLIFGSANRDERHYTNADQFDITRRPTDHLGWGNGPHMCIGMHLAKLEMEVMLEAMVEHVSEIKVGDPVLSTNRGLYGFESLPMTLH